MRDDRNKGKGPIGSGAPGEADEEDGASDRAQAGARNVHTKPGAREHTAFGGRAIPATPRIKPSAAGSAKRTLLGGVSVPLPGNERPARRPSGDVPQSGTSRAQVGASTLREGEDSEAHTPRYKAHPSVAQQTLLGVAPLDLDPRAPATTGDVAGAPVLPIGTLNPEQEFGSPDPSRRAAPAQHHEHYDPYQQQRSTARDLDEPKTQPAVPVESYEAPRDARQAVVRDSTSHAAVPQPGRLPGFGRPLRRPSHLPTMPPLRQSIVSMAAGKIGNAALIAIVAGAAMIVIAAELLRSEPEAIDPELLIDPQPESARPEVTGPATVGGNPATTEATQGKSTEPLAKTGLSTRIETNPPGAEIVFQGAVIANTPATVRRPQAETDYLLRKPGYQPQLVRLSGTSPKLINLNLEPTAGTAPAENPGAPVNGLDDLAPTAVDDPALEALDEAAVGPQPDAPAKAAQGTATADPQDEESEEQAAPGAGNLPRGRSGLPLLPSRSRRGSQQR